MHNEDTKTAVRYDSTGHFELDLELVSLVTGGLPGCGGGDPPPADTVCFGDAVCSINASCPDECGDVNLGCPTGEPVDFVCGDTEGNLNVVC